MRRPPPRPGRSLARPRRKPQKPPQEGTGVPRALLLASLLSLLVVLAIRIRFLDLPFERDEGEYAYGAQVLLRGGLPFRDFYTLKLPGAHAAYAPALLLFGETVTAVRLGYLAASLATACLVFLLARKLAGTWAGVAAAPLFLVATSNLSFLGLFAHATQFLVLPMTAGVLALVQARGREKRLPWLLLSGVLLGMAVVVKQHASFFVLFGAAAAFVQERSMGADLRRAGRGAGALLLGAALPLGILSGLLWARGCFSDFWLWCFRYAPQYVSLQTPWEGLKQGATQALDDLRSLPVLVALAAWGAVAGKRRGDRALLLGWLLAGAASVFPGLYFREHYFVPLLPVLAVLAGVGVADLLRRGPGLRWAAAAAVLFSALWPLYRDRFFLLEPDDRLAMRRLYRQQPFAEAVQVSGYLRARARPGDRLAVLGSEPEILFLSRIPSATGYLYTYPLMETHSLAQWMQHDLMRRLEADPPRWIALVSAANSWMAPHTTAQTPIIDWMDRFLPAHYDVVGVADIVSPYRTVYLWDEAARDYEGRSSSAIWVYRRRDPL